MIGFVSVIEITNEEKRGRSTVPMIAERIINVDEISEICEGQTRMDGERAYDTSIIVKKDGTEIEIDGSLPLVRKALSEITGNPVVLISPEINERTDEEVQREPEVEAARPVGPSNRFIKEGEQEEVREPVEDSKPSRSRSRSHHSKSALDTRNEL